MRWYTAIALYWAAGIFVIAFHCGFGDTGGHRCDYYPKWEIHQRKKKKLHVADYAAWSLFFCGEGLAMKKSLKKYLADNETFIKTILASRENHAEKTTG